MMMRISSAMTLITPGTKAAVAVVPRLFMPMTFWIEGEPGAIMEMVQQPAVMEAGIRMRDMSFFWKSCRVMGYITKYTTKPLIPPKVRMEVMMNTSTATCLPPVRRLRKRAMDLAAPEPS